MRWLSWEWSAADEEFRRSIALDSTYAAARLWYALYLSGRRRSGEAIRQITRARDLDPLSLIVNTEVGRVLELARRDSEAELAYMRTLEIDSTYWLANYLLTMLHFRAGQFGSASADLARLGASRETELPEVRGYGYARKGDVAAARRSLADLRRLSAKRYVSPYSIACIYAALGDRSEAITWLEKAYAAHASEMGLFIADPILDSVRSDARYARLVHRMRLD
jgi:Flp pilus assembly protein TadD